MDYISPISRRYLKVLPIRDRFKNTIIDFILDEPYLVLDKGAVATGNPNAIFIPAPPGPFLLPLRPVLGSDGQVLSVQMVYQITRSAVRLPMSMRVTWSVLPWSLKIWATA